MATPRRLVTIGRSYVVALNRQLADAIGRAAGGRWEVTAVGPAQVRGDLRPIRFEPTPPGSAYTPAAVPTYFGRPPHTLAFGRSVGPLLGGRWDLVHVWEEPFVLAGWQAARAAPPGVPVVFSTFQNLSKWYPPPFGWFERRTVERAAGWVAFGQTAADALLPRPGYAGRPHRVIPVGVDVDRFRPDPAAGAAVRRRLGWEADGPPVVGYLGRFVPEKGVEMLTRVLDAVPAPWRALLVGGGPLEAALRAWGAGHGDRVRVVTGVAHADVPAHLNAMDILAAPSRTTPRWKEQFGRMLTEAFACGVAVVGSDSGEIPHVLGDAGRVVGEADEAGWVGGLTDWVADPAARTDAAARGLARARERFAWPVVGRAHVEFFDELTG